MDKRTAKCLSTDIALELFAILVGTEWLFYGIHFRADVICDVHV